jgi:hypothetical protein
VNVVSVTYIPTRVEDPHFNLLLFVRDVTVVGVDSNGRLAELKQSVLGIYYSLRSLLLHWLLTCTVAL